jgi:hypothetical protein
MISYFNMLMVLNNTLKRRQLSAVYQVKATKGINFLHNKGKIYTNKRIVREL